MKWTFTTEHKSKGSTYQAHELMAVKPDGYRDLTFEENVGRDGDIFTIRDNDPVVRLELDPAGVEFLLSALPEGDRYTELVRYAAALSRTTLWDRAAAA